MNKTITITFSLINIFIFSNCFNNIDQCWCKWMVDELLVLLGTGNKLTVENVLNILTELTEKRIDKIQPLATRLMVNTI